jgi:hypothetical protein
MSISLPVQVTLSSGCANAWHENIRRMINVNLFILGHGPVFGQACGNSSMPVAFCTAFENVERRDCGGPLLETDVHAPRMRAVEKTLQRMGSDRTTVNSG